MVNERNKYKKEEAERKGGEKGEEKETGKTKRKHCEQEQTETPGRNRHNSHL